MTTTNKHRSEIFALADEFVEKSAAFSPMNSTRQRKVLTSQRSLP